MTHPACKWYVSIDQPECGLESVAEVRVRTSVADATVPLCRKHKAIHDERAASIRNARREARIARLARENKRDDSAVPFSDKGSN